MAAFHRTDTLSVISYLLLLMALLLDRLLGEPRRWHPLVGFGRIVQKLEDVGLGQQGHLSRSRSKLRRRGALAAILAIAVPTLAVYAVLHFAAQASPMLSLLLQAMLLYLCIGWRSLQQHGLAVQQSLEAGDLPQARERAAMMVSRDTRSLDETGVTKATVESVLENGSDATFAPIFWFVVGGAPAVVLYRLANTLDAMWGYRTPRLQHFGWFAARLDDVLNYLPARLCAWSYALAGHTHSALQCWRQQAVACSSPNGGPVMTAGAGALQVTLGGPAIYHGTSMDKPVLGQGRTAVKDDILRACQLINRSLLLWVVAIGAVSATAQYVSHL
jgi:adenosylcobinamide-phosphate synthase